MRAEEGGAWLFLVIMCRSGKCTGLVMPLLERDRPRQLLMNSGKFLVQLSRNRGGSPSLLYQSIPASLCRKQVFGPGDNSVSDEKGKPKYEECKAERYGRRVALLLL